MCAAVAGATPEPVLPELPLNAQPESRLAAASIAPRITRLPIAIELLLCVVIPWLIPLLCRKRTYHRSGRVEVGSACLCCRHLYCAGPGDRHNVVANGCRSAGDSKCDW